VCSQRPELFVLCIPALRLPFSCFGVQFLFQLDAVSLNDGGNQAWEAFLDFRAARGVMHLDASTFAPNQACFSQCLKMLREGGFRYSFLADVQKVRAILRTFRADDIDIDCYAHRIGERVKDTFDGNVFNRRMKERLHGTSL